MNDLKKIECAKILLEEVIQHLEQKIKLAVNASTPQDDLSEEAQAAKVDLMQ